MHLLDKFVLLPSTNQLILSHYFTLLALIVLMPFMGLFLGSSFFSLAFNLIGMREKNPTLIRFSHTLLDTVLFNNKYVGLIFGVLPVLVLTFSLSHYYYSSGLAVSSLFIPMTFFAALGLSLVYGYRHTFEKRESRLLIHIGLGLMGVVVLLAFTYALIGSLSLMIDFEKRFFVEDPSGLLFSWNALARYKSFLFLSVGLTGAGTLFFLSDRFEAGRRLDKELKGLVESFGHYACMFSVLIIPLFLVWNLVTLPTVALSGTVVLFSLLQLASLLAGFFLILRRDGRRGSFSLFLVLLSAQFIVTITDNAAMRNASREYQTLLFNRALAAEEEVALAREAKAASEVIDEKLGEKIFESRCSACHRFESRLVGPPFNEVLPKYKDDFEGLVTFVLNPSKKNPGYPPMPNLGLRREEARSAVKYVLDRLGKKDKI